METRIWLKDLRSKQGFTQAETASKLGIAASYYSMIEKGERKKKMTLELAHNIANLFDTSIDYILEKESEA